MSAKQNPALQLVTWNINRCGADAVARHRDLIEGLDVLLLQEVGHADRSALITALGDLGLVHCSGVEVGRKSYGNLIASKHRLEPLQQLGVETPFPELLVGANIQLAIGRLAVICVHAPNGSGNGWDKIHVLRALRSAAQQLGRERLVIGGDFNEPRYFPGIVPVRSFAWTDEESWEHRQNESWTRRNAKGESETASRASWDDAVRWFFEPRSELRHAHWEHLPAGSMEPTHWSRGASPERWFDHCFVSKRVLVRSSRYLHELNRGSGGPSDHSGLYVQLELMD